MGKVSLPLKQRQKITENRIGIWRDTILFMDSQYSLYLVIKCDMKFQYFGICFMVFSSVKYIGTKKFPLLDFPTFR